jgi:hypothetical protein
LQSIAGRIQCIGSQDDALRRAILSSPLYPFCLLSKLSSVLGVVLYPMGQQDVDLGNIAHFFIPPSITSSPATSRAISSLLIIIR